MWGSASRDFARSLSGDILVIAAEANPFRFFTQIELAELRLNPNVNTVGGKAVGTLSGMFLEDAAVLVSSQFKSAVVSGALFAVNHADEAAAVVSKQVYSKLGYVIEAAPDAAQLAAAGLEVVSHSPSIVRNLFVIAGHGALRFLGSVSGGVLIDFFLNIEPLNANELNILALTSDLRSDLPAGAVPDRFSLNADGSAEIRFSLNMPNGNPAIDTWLKVSGAGEAISISTIAPHSDQTVTVNHSAGTAIEFAIAGVQFSRAADGSPIIVIPGANGVGPQTVNLDQTSGDVTIVAGNHTIEAIPGSDISVNADRSIVVTEFWNNEIKSITEVSADLSRAVRTWDLQDQFAWDSRVTSYGADGQVGFSVEIADNGSVSAAQVNGVPIDLGAIGGALGSRLGNMLGHNTFTKIAAGTVLGAIGREVGQLVQFGHSVSLEAVVNGGFAQVLPTFGAGLASGAVGSLTSLLIAELGEALHLDGFTTGLVSTVGTTITQRLAANAFDIAVNGAAVETLFNGFSSTGFFTNMAGAVGGYLGGVLAGVVAMPTSPEGAIGQQIGSSIGGLLGSVFGPLGSFVGSFAGGIAGGQLGALFGNDPESGGRIVLRADGQLDIIEKWEDHGGSYQWIDAPAKRAQGGVQVQQLIYHKSSVKRITLGVACVVVLWNRGMRERTATAIAGAYHNVGKCKRGQATRCATREDNCRTGLSRSGVTRRRRRVGATSTQAFHATTPARTAWSRMRTGNDVSKV